jgi:hypothetical protein
MERCSSTFKIHNASMFPKVYVILGFEVLTAVVMKSSVFWDVTM